MSIAKSSRSFIKILLSILLIVHSHRLSAAPLTYNDCVSASSNISYSVGGWCFYLYRNSAWPNRYPSQDIAQTMCGPYGNLAVGVTYKMLSTMVANPMIQAGGVYAWLGLISNNSVANQGWMWSTLLPNGQTLNFPAIMSNMPWGPGEPNNDGGFQRSGVVQYIGVDDMTYNISQASRPVAVICQFAAPKWKYSQRGHGRFAGISFKIAQSNIPRLGCLLQCYLHPGCVSLAYNPTNNDCQLYNASPEDSRFSANVTADSTYDWHIRDGMVY